LRDRPSALRGGTFGAAWQEPAAAPSPDLENRTSWPNRKKNHRSVAASVAHGTITVKI
jgi:hypothetical protein